MKMKKFKAVIFDMDGTLIDTSAIWKICNEMFLIQRGIFTQQLYEKINDTLHGIPIRRGISDVKSLCKLEHVPDSEIFIEYDMLVKKYYELEITYIKECQTFIKKLCRYNIPMAIATNSCDYGIERVNKVVNLKQYFNSHIYGISCVGHVCKPSPDIFLYAAKQLGMKPEDCVVFEDSLHGITAAKNASMYTIAINTSKVKENLIHADKIIDCYSEINLQDYFLLPDTY